MTGNTSKKIFSLVLLGVGVVSLVSALVMDFMRLEYDFRGTLLIVGILGIIFGLFTLPTEK